MSAQASCSHGVVKMEGRTEIFGGVCPLCYENLLGIASILESKLERAREGLDKYGRHFGECKSNNAYLTSDRDCSCGFEQALSDLGDEGR